ncbi:DNA polymerase III subunit delta [Arcanobacterium bovis]|uniref:DNA-directed DNA polymerase n=1 Tax=Arcanobacterium bovis TaxID=2529275 RepID=A0A4Q9V1N3_9ACTO|nr:DNA polymerase III subunit delta [Arcanobacterium bovis]TBW22020.1 DNA polymerase III subunit delta [Arcanobacterium bovis]
MAVWESLELRPLILIKSGEPVYGDRATDHVKQQLRARDPNTDVTTIDAADYQNGQLQMLTTPTLFGEPRAVIIPNVEQATDAFLNDALEYVEMPEQDVVVLFRHNGGVRGKKLLDKLVAERVPTITINAVKQQAEKINAVMADVSAQGRTMSKPAVEALIDALGSDLRELLSATNQLLNDIPGNIGDDDVHKYFSGRIEANGYRVADALVTGDVGRAIELARHAMATGASPVSIVSSLALKFRSMALVLGQRSSKLGVKDTMQQWQRDRAKRELRYWSAEGLAQAICEIARADVDVKGGSRDAGYALERAILAVGRARRIR